MAGSFFDDKATRPDDVLLSKVLGKAKKPWDAIVDYLEEEAEGLTREWKFYGAKHGWQLKVARKKGAVLYLIPRQGRFTAAMALKEDAVARVRASGLPPSLIREIEAAKPYSEGRPARVEVSTHREVALVKQLLIIKLAGLR